MKKNIFNVFVLMGLMALFGVTACNINTEVKAPEIVGSPVIDGQKIVLSFTTNIEAFDKNKIIVKKIMANGSVTNLNEGTDYNIEKSSQTLVINLLKATVNGEKFNVELQAGAVTGNGKPNTTPKTQPVVSVLKKPVLSGNAILENSTIILSFNVPISKKDDSKITVRRKATGASSFSGVNPSGISLDKMKLSIALNSPVDGDTYRVEFAAGAVFNQSVANDKTLTSSDVVFSLSPILSGKKPYVLGKQIVLAFNRNIAIKNHDNIVVEEKASGEADFTALDDTALPNENMAVDTNDKKILKITLKTVLTVGGQYKISFGAGAVNEENKAGNENKAIEASTITLKAGPALVALNPYYLSGTGNNTLFIILNMNNLEILDKSKVKVLKNDGSDTYNALSSADLPTSNIAVDTSKNRLKITLSTSVNDKYKIQLDSGAIVSTSSENAAANNAIAPAGIITHSSTAAALSVNPLSLPTNRTSLVVNFTPAVSILSANSIQVKKKATGSSSVSTLATADRTVEVDSNDNVLITLNDNVEVGERYQVVFPVGSVLDKAVRISSPVERTTNELQIRYSDVYQWDEVQIRNVDATKTDVWGSRTAFEVVVHNGSIFIMGGTRTVGKKSVLANDIWKSSDGVVWTKVGATDVWGARTGFAAVSHNGSIWVMGGLIGSSASNDVYYSTNGKDWTKENTTGIWSGRFGHAAVVHGGKIWVSGTHSSVKNEQTNLLYNSSNGKDWTKVNMTTPLPRRYFHSMASFDGKLWVIAGLELTLAKTEVWVSTDNEAKIWKKQATLDDGKVMYSPASVVYKNRLWIMGGDSFGNRVLSLGTGNSASWVEERNGSWSARYGHGAVVLGTGSNEKIWLMGGDTVGEDEKDDVWTFGPSPASSK